MRPFPVIALLTSLSACAMAETGVDGTDARAGDCGAEALQHLVGQPQAVLAERRLPAPTRLIGPDTAVTMDHNPDRLNIRYDEGGILREIYCG